jgi:hypothetical protein
MCSDTAPPPHTHTHALHKHTTPHGISQRGAWDPTTTHAPLLGSTLTAIEEGGARATAMTSAPVTTTCTSTKLRGKRSRGCRRQAQQSHETAGQMGTKVQGSDNAAHVNGCQGAAGRLGVTKQKCMVGIRKVSNRGGGLDASSGGGTYAMSGGTMCPT